MCLNIVATLGFNICLVAILCFSSFNFYQIYILRFGVILSNWPNLKVKVISNIRLLISWNICSIDIILLIGLVDKLCDTIGSIDTSNLIYMNYSINLLGTLNIAFWSCGLEIFRCMLIFLMYINPQAK
jgi:hypothetical protein